MPKARLSGELDFSAFPPNTITTYHKTICLACVADVFTKLLGLAAKKTALEMKGYTPSVEELTAATAVRPYFEPGETDTHCPYCDSSEKKHAVLTAHCVEGGKATDVPRRKLIASLPKEYAVVEEKSTHDEAFFTWLEKMAKMNAEDEFWLRDVTKAYLERLLPKEDWDKVFAEVYTARRSSRLEEGWEIDNRRLFLSPPIYWETVAVQYVISRSQMGGGVTFEGRMTLHELVNALRFSGYLRHIGVHAHNPADVLEALMHHLAGGDGGVKMYYVVDRRDFLGKLDELKIAEPKTKPAPTQNAEAAKGDAPPKKTAPAKKTTSGKNAAPAKKSTSAKAAKTAKKTASAKKSPVPKKPAANKAKPAPKRKKS